MCIVAEKNFEVTEILCFRCLKNCNYHRPAGWQSCENIIYTFYILMILHVNLEITAWNLKYLTISWNRTQNLLPSNMKTGLIADI